MFGSIVEDKFYGNIVRENFMFFGEVEFIEGIRKDKRKGKRCRKR